MVFIYYTGSLTKHCEVDGATVRASKVGGSEAVETSVSHTQVGNGEVEAVTGE